MRMTAVALSENWRSTAKGDKKETLGENSSGGNPDKKTIRRKVGGLDCAHTLLRTLTGPGLRENAQREHGCKERGLHRRKKKKHLRLLTRPRGLSRV